MKYLEELNKALLTFKRYVPLDLDNAESFLEYLNYLSDLLEDTIEGHNLLVDEIIKLKVEIDGLIKEYTKENIKELVESGVIEEIINDEIFSKINEEIETLKNVKRDKDVLINMGDLDTDVKLALTGGSVGVVDAQSVDFNNLSVRIQKDIGLYKNIDYQTTFGGWNDDGSENNDSYAVENYLRTQFLCSSGENITLKMDTGSIKKFIVQDDKNEVLAIFSTNNKEFEFNTPSNAFRVKFFFQKAGSITPKIERLVYDNFSSKRYAEQKDSELLEKLYFDGIGNGGHNIQEKHLFTKFQKDSGKLSNINIKWVDGGWNTNGTENNSIYALDNYTRTQYNIQQEQTGRLLHLEGLWTTALQVVRTYDKNNNLIEEKTFDNQYVVDFEVSNRTKTIKIQAYKSVKPQLSHYVYDSIASKKYVDEKVKDVGDNVMKPLPDYYFPYIDEKITKIRNLLLNTSGDSFIYITDTHWGNNIKRSNSIIDYVRKKTDINKVFFGGDIITAFGSHETMMEQNYDFNRYFSDFKLFKDWFSIVGNHDFTIRFKNDGSSEGSTLNKEETYNLIFRNLESYLKLERGEMCYYFDNDNSKIRYVFINTQDGVIDTSVGWGLTYDISQKQLDWLSDVALNTDYSIVINGHIPIHEEMPTYSENMQTVRKLFEGYNNRLNVVHSFNGKTINKDFKNAKGNIIMYLCGHNHQDKEFITNNLKHISCGCDALYKDDVFDRNPNTISEQIVSVFIVEKTGKINIVRIGAGLDRTI